MIGEDDAETRDELVRIGHGGEGEKGAERRWVADSRRGRGNLGTRKILAWECMKTCMA